MNSDSGQSPFHAYIQTSLATGNLRNCKTPILNSTTFATPFFPILLQAGVSFETSFNPNQPKLEPKLVSALFETKRLFRLFRFYSKTASFGVSVKPKLTETNRNQPKQAENSAFCFSILSLKLSVLHHLFLSLDVSVLLYCLWIYSYLL